MEYDVAREELEDGRRRLRWRSTDCSATRASAVVQPFKARVAAHVPAAQLHGVAQQRQAHLTFNSAPDAHRSTRSVRTD